MNCPYRKIQASVVECLEQFLGAVSGKFSGKSSDKFKEVLANSISKILELAHDRAVDFFSRCDHLQHFGMEYPCPKYA